MVSLWRDNSRRFFWSALTILLVFCLLALIGAWGAMSWTRRGVALHREAGHDSSASSPNLRAQGKYVGDEACARCHARIAKTYHQHPMARTCAPVSSVLALDRYDKQNHNPFLASGLQFQVEHRGQQLFHQAIKLDSEGREVARSEAEVQFVIGAGVRGRSYVMNRRGHLFQTPISWYSERQAWDLSPHLGTSVEQLYRPVQPLCLFCHANQVDPVEHSGNRFHEPIFRGYAIGCERCHGPGEFHVKRHQSGESGLDDDIVNPSHLEPALREAVCQQCHLQGIVRIARRGRHVFDYRPGFPLQDYWSVFVKSPALDNQKKFSSQVEQMFASRCYRASRGKLGCISCHDPHRVPAAEEKPAYYRQRCLACHQENSCRLSPTVRRKQSPGDSCVECHMKRIGSNIAHMASTDHRILRRPENGPATPSPSNANQWLEELSRSPENALVLFDQNWMGAGDDEIRRDLGLALIDLAGLKIPPSIRSRLAQRALPLLAASVQTWPEDVPSWQSQGYALWLLDRKPEALAALETALSKAPEREETLIFAAALSAQLGQTEAAIGYWRRALNVNPWSDRSHYELARLLAKDKQWQTALSEATEAMAINPFHLETRLLLIECHLELGHKDQAQREFREVLRLNPPDAAALSRWFDQRMR